MDLTKIKELLEGNEKSKEILSEINKQNGLDVQAQKEIIEEVKKQKNELEQKFSELKESSLTNEDLKTKYDELVKKINEDKLKREEAEKQAKLEEEHSTRFSGVIGVNKFRDELTQEAVYNKFKNALLDSSNKGKGDKEIFDELTKDQNYFINPNQAKKLPSVETSNDNITKEAFNKMGYLQRNALFNSNPELYKSLTGKTEE